jgi:hypothetical protein
MAEPVRLVAQVAWIPDADEHTTHPADGGNGLEDD